MYFTNLNPVHVHKLPQILSDDVGVTEHELFHCKNFNKNLKNNRKKTAVRKARLFNFLKDSKEISYFERESIGG